ncbi:hypothetical protein VKT23_008291 [Stygiomarasmius scandens]|uniref:F-box domain-containing protein n=1 Tax=Marasmiellus scandens TaxID=2682957 RepID=A0ABR1JIQ5_9AGAR
MPAIPLEVIGEIIDYAQGSVPTLKTCTLVCHAWLPRARRHLFCEITLPPRSVLTPMSSQKDFQMAVSELVTTITSPRVSIRPPVGLLTRKLTLGTVFGHEEDVKSLSECGVLRNLPFTRLETVVFTSLAYDEQHLGADDLLATFLQQNQGIKSFGLHYCSLPYDPRSIFEVFSMLAGLDRPALQSLSLRGNHCVGFNIALWRMLFDAYVEYRDRHTTRLESLELSFRDSNLAPALLEALFLHPKSFFDIGTLRTLTLIPQLPNLSDYLRIIMHDRCNVHFIRVALVSDSPIHDLSVLARLESLVELELVVLSWFWTNALVHLFKVLESLTPGPNLRRISLIFRPDYCVENPTNRRDVTRLFASSFDALFSRLLGAKFVRPVECVSIVISPFYCFSIDCIREYLPQSLKDDRLNVEVADVYVDEIYL